MILQPGKLGQIGLGNITILAKTAAKVASDTANGKDNFPWMEMIKRLFLDGIIMDSRQFTINLGDKTAIYISPNPALSCFTLGKATIMGTKKALYPAVFNFPEVEGIYHGFVQVKESWGIVGEGKDQK
jgi:hypothetical protein